jgi:hypothetical protein
MPKKKKSDKAPAKKRNPSIKNLDKDQRSFIEGKVKDLGSMEAVKKFYRLDDAVSYFAMKTAKRLKLPETVEEKDE